MKSKLNPKILNDLKKEMKTSRVPKNFNAKMGN